MNSTQALILWIRIALIVASIFTTAVPVIYSFAPWRTLLLGRLFMYQAISFAVAMDIRVVLLFWKPPSMMWAVYWVNGITISLIAIATASLAIYIWRAIFFKKAG